MVHICVGSRASCAMQTLFQRILETMGHPNLWETRWAYPDTSGMSKNLQMILNRSALQLAFLFPKPAVQAALWIASFGGFCLSPNPARKHSFFHAHTGLQQIGVRSDLLTLAGSLATQNVLFISLGSLNEVVAHNVRHQQRSDCLMCSEMDAIKCHDLTFF